MKQWLVIGAMFTALLVLAGFQQNTIESLKQKCTKYQHNTESLLSDVEQYKTRDSLNAAKAKSLELTIQEYRKFRAADAQLIETLQIKNRDLAEITTAQSQTIIDLSTAPHDTVIVRDSILIQAATIHTGDAWFDFDGLLTESGFTGSLTVRDSLLIAETIRYKRFLGFLWKTKHIQDRQIDVVNRNPHTTILNCEHAIIER